MLSFMVQNIRVKKTCKSLISGRHILNSLKVRITQSHLSYRLPSNKVARNFQYALCPENKGMNGWMIDLWMDTVSPNYLWILYFQILYFQKIQKYKNVFVTPNHT